MLLPSCCERSLAAGESPSVHALVCDRRPPEPPEELETDTLFDLDPPEHTEGGQHL